MKVLLVVLGALFVFTAVLAVVSAPDSQSVVPDTWQVVSESSGQDMARKHQSMMDQMRASAMPQMESLMTADPMRTGLDADMIELMEQDQTQIDRMLARG